ncbi:endothelin-converting enzyme 2-like [Dermacentor silvarum]|uniref:endothelin-converting enzyme 2-like n=1 Tax=Dermacentor silvarum TaxID=543639 RepID=UPI0021011B7A|nr:endothelin-converting enzyme 2-like [Dermacentor silvarum]
MGHAHIWSAERYCFVGSSPQQKEGRRPGSTAALLEWNVKGPVIGSSSEANRRRQRRINRTIIFLVIMIGALLTVLTLVLSEKKGTSTDRITCLSTSCQSYVRSLEASINPGADPCEDFYSFVCSRWMPVTGGRSFMDDAKLAFRDSVMAAADTSLVPTENQNPFQKAVMFYQSCKRRPYYGVDPLLAVLKDVGIPWPTVNDSIDPLEALFSLAFDWRCPIFFAAHVSSDNQPRRKLIIFRTFMGIDFNVLLHEHLSRDDNVRYVCRLHAIFSETLGQRTRNQYANSTPSCERVFPDGAYESVNYASIGSLIAGQLVTAWDLKGRTIDANDLDRHWLTAAEEARQNGTMECLVEAFNVRIQFPGVSEHARRVCDVRYVGQPAAAF